MLPTWATVTIALGGSFFTALVALFGSRTTIKVARMQLDRARGDAWENRRLKAAEDLAIAAANVPLCTQDGNLAGARKARAEAATSLAQVSFLFGPESKVTLSAETLVKGLRDYLKNPDEKDWRKRFETDPFDAFHAALYAAMKPPRELGSKGHLVERLFSRQV
jgi:hypothetical protein